jgi:phospholipid/cholesterol/gamma-HCH transport system substrate-binding protein
MPRTRSLAWAELRTGVLIIAALAIGAVSIFMLTGGRGFPWQRYHLKTRFATVEGLRPGSPVRVAGVDVGTVSDMTFAGDEVEITLQVNRTMSERITTRSTASLGSVSLLGESAVDITPAVSGTPLPEWGYVPWARGRGQIADVTEQATSSLEAISQLVEDVRAGRGTVGQLLTNDRVYAELQRVLTLTGDLTQSLRDGRGSIGRLLTDPAMAESLETSLANIEMLTRQISAGDGSVGRLLNDSQFADSLSSAAASLDRLMANVNAGQGTAGKLLTDDTLINRLNSVAARFDEVAGGLANGEGTAGQLLKDDRLYENMNGAVTDLRELVAEIRKDPRRYLSVRISIW